MTSIERACVLVGAIVIGRGAVQIAFDIRDRCREVAAMVRQRRARKAGAR